MFHNIKKIVIPSLIAKNQSELDALLAKMAGIQLSKGTQQLMQLDIMDGIFVPNTSLNFSFSLRKSLSKIQKTKFEAHLMVAEPEKWIEMLMHSGNSGRITAILFHIESCIAKEKSKIKEKDKITDKGNTDSAKIDSAKVIKIIRLIRNNGKKAGIAINPETPASEAIRFIRDIDEVLIMTVTPGFYGSVFLPETLNKVRQIRSINSKINIEVDGSINDKTIKTASNAGANYFVSGSFIISSKNPKSSVTALEKLIK